MSEGGQLMKIHWAFWKAVYFCMGVICTTFRTDDLTIMLRLLIIVLFTTRNPFESVKKKSNKRRDLYVFKKKELSITRRKQ